MIKAQSEMSDGGWEMGHEQEKVEAEAGHYRSPSLVTSLRLFPTYVSGTSPKPRLSSSSEWVGGGVTRGDPPSFCLSELTRTLKILLSLSALFVFGESF